MQDMDSVNIHLLKRGENGEKAPAFKDTIVYAPSNV
jgi:hypothetical protein